MIPTQMWRWATLLAAFGILLALSPAALPQAQKHLTVYAPATLFSLSVQTIDGRDYVVLSDALEPLGTVEAKEDGKRWRLRFTPPGGSAVDAEFQDGSNRGKVRGHDVELSANFHLESGKGYVPLHNLGTLLPVFTSLNGEFRESSLRLLLGNVAIQFNQDLQKGAASKLVLTFSSPVNPMVATEPGRLRLIFRREPLVNAGPDTTQFNDANLPSSTYSENAGIPELAVNSPLPLTAAFSESNKVITISPVAPGAVPSESTTTANTPAPAQPSPAAAPSVPAPPRFLVLIDPAHGGDERGAAITDAIQEKDVNLAFARRLQHELQNKGINAALLRTGDNTLGLDERAIAINSAHPALYICVHAANLGSGMRIFTALMQPTGAGSRKFLPWQQAQAPFLDISSQVAGSISAELTNKQITVTALPAPLRPLRNVATPAVALEIAPPEDEPAGINGAEYQQTIAVAVANGVAAMKPKLQGAR